MTDAGVATDVRPAADPPRQPWWRGRWVPFVIVTVVVALPLRGLLRAPGPPMEEGFMLVFPEQVLRGAIPNKDFLHLYGPGSLWVLAGIFKAFGTSLWTERVAGLAQQLALVGAVYVAVRPWGRRVATGGAVIAAVIIIPPIGLTALAWVGGVALGLWAMIAALRGRLLLAGVLAGFALLYRPDLVVAVGLGLFVVWRVVDHVRRVRLLKGLAIGVSPFLIQIALAGPWDAFFGMVLQPVFQLRGGRHLPLPPSWGHFDGFLQKAGRLAEPPWPFPAPPSPGQLTLWLVLLVLVAGFTVYVGWSTMRRERGRRRGDGHRSLDTAALLVLGLFAAGLLPQAIQRPDSTHLSWVSAVPFGILPAAVFELLHRRAPGWSPGRRGLFAALVPSLLLIVIVPHFTFRTYADYVAQTFDRHRESYVIENEGRSFYYGRKDAADAVNAMLPVVDGIARPGDKLFVGTGDLRKTPYSEAFLYYLLPQTDPGTRYIEMDPGVANRDDSGLEDDLASSDIVILSSIRDDWDEPNDARKFGSDAANEVLHRDFCMVGSFGKGLFDRGLYEVYQRCDRTA